MNQALDVDALKCKLKHLVIKEFLELIKRLNKGKSVDYEIILEQISAIEYSDSVFILQYYLNNEQYNINS